MPLSRNDFQRRPGHDRAIRNAIVVFAIVYVVTRIGIHILLMLPAGRDLDSLMRGNQYFGLVVHLLNLSVALCAGIIEYRLVLRHQSPRS